LLLLKRCQEVIEEIEMKRGPHFILLGLGCLVLAATPALAQYPYPPPPPPPPPVYYPPPPPPPPSHDQFVEFRLWAGGFFPTFGGTFWNNNFANNTGNRNDFQNVIGGGDFIFHFDRYNALMVSASYYQGSSNEQSRFFTDQFNNPIRQRLTLDVSSGTVAYALFPAGTHNAVIPYLGAGVGVYGWRLHTDSNGFGAPFAFGGPNGDSAEFGYFFVAGLEVPVSRHVALLVDGRYTQTPHNDNNFRPDLSGGQVEGGIAFHL
jgi:opacity protein-like surface antigen